MAAAQWERLKTGLGIAEPVPTEPERFPQQLLHQLDEATTLSKTQVCSCGVHAQLSETPIVQLGLN